MGYNLSDLTIKLLIAGFFITIIVSYIKTFFASYDYIMGHLSEYLYIVAEKKCLREFKKNKKQIYTKKGDYTAIFNKAVQTKINELNTSCQFYSQDFYHFYRHRRPLLKCRVDDLIMNYIKNHSDHIVDNNFNSITPEQFFKLKKTMSGDMVGVYVIYNKNKKMYYVGQATRLFFRVNQHFTGHGNGDVYADYKRGGDKFTIKLCPLVNSGYFDLDKFEKDMIAKYDAYNNGYNKTIGNGDW